MGRTPPEPGPRALPVPRTRRPYSAPGAQALRSPRAPGCAEGSPRSAALPGPAPGLRPGPRAQNSRTASRPGPAGPSRSLRPARGRLRPARPHAPRRSHRLVGVDVDLEGLLLEGLQGDQHGAGAQLRCRACSGCWPLGGVCGLAGPRGRPRSSRTREEGGGGGGLSHSPCGAASPPALGPGRAAPSATAAFLASSGRRASSRARRRPLSLQEARGALRDKQRIR